MQVLNIAHGVASRPRRRCVRGQKFFPVTGMTVAEVDMLMHRSTILGMNADNHRRHLLKVIEAGYDRLYALKLDRNLVKIRCFLILEVYALTDDGARQADHLD